MPVWQATPKGGNWRELTSRDGGTRQNSSFYRAPVLVCDAIASIAVQGINSLSHRPARGWASETGNAKCIRLTGVSVLQTSDWRLAKGNREWKMHQINWNILRVLQAPRNQSQPWAGAPGKTGLLTWASPTGLSPAFVRLRPSQVRNKNDRKKGSHRLLVFSFTLYCILISYIIHKFLFKDVKTYSIQKTE